ncbi:DUF998 domain-containing protein [Candidatus Bathyarchaeota archaeon]|nr:DUF998 domain-containing protein [Candidatus Bathyarchaeota archaeon]
MNKRVYALLGIIGPLVAYISIGVSIVRSPWFSWETSALSDLGHTVDSEAAPIFNLGLLLAGFLIMVYAVTVFKRHAKYTSIFLVMSALSLQLVATFDEVYGFLHVVVSVMLFLSLGAASLTYAIERKSSLAAATFMTGLISWVLFGMKAYSLGVAVPETISTVMAVSWMIYSAIRIMRA